MIVVKAGGNGIVDMQAMCADIAELTGGGEAAQDVGPIIVVHGGSHETNVISEKLGHPARFVTSVSGVVSRYLACRRLPPEDVCLLDQLIARRHHVLQDFPARQLCRQQCRVSDCHCHTGYQVSHARTHPPPAAGMSRGFHALADHHGPPPITPRPDNRRGARR